MRKDQEVLLFNTGFLGENPNRATAHHQLVCAEEKKAFSGGGGVGEGVAIILGSLHKTERVVRRGSPLPPFSCTQSHFELKRRKERGKKYIVLSCVPHTHSYIHDTLDCPTCDIFDMKSYSLC